MTHADRRAVLAVAGAALTSALLRLRFLHAPLNVDEAGALTVARAWASGPRPYVDLFIDRPQGVLLGFQRWDAWFGPSPGSVRAFALLVGIVVVIGAAAIARAVSGRNDAAIVAAWLVAVISSSAAIEGYAANGELLAGTLTVPAMAVGALVVTRRAPPPWMVLAGALAAGGITVKQSGFDVLAALGLWLLVAAWRRWRSIGEVVALGLWLGLGAGVVLGATAWHGATFGWDAYGYAIYGFRAHARSAFAGPQGGRMVLTLLVALPLLGPAVLLALRRVRQLGRPLAPRLRPGHALVLGWAALALAGFFAGGNYHRHYWIQLTFPVATVAAIAITAGRPLTRRQLVRTTALAVALPLAISIALIVHPAWEQDPRVAADASIAQWYRAHRTSSDDDLLPLCASVVWYVDVDQVPRTPYLWVDHVRYGRGSLPGLLALLEGDDRPTYLAMHDPADRCDPTGQLARSIARHYRPAATIDGVDILQAA